MIPDRLSKVLSAPEPVMAEPLVDDFKQAMRRLAATVAIITAGKDRERTGMTATAVSAVSTEPPSLVIGVNRQASLHGAVTRSRAFCVNILSADHTDLVQPFSGKSKGDARFAFGAWEDHVSGAPFLKDAPANLFCTLDAELDYGSHTLFVGRVKAIRMIGAASPLVWQDGQSASILPVAPRPPGPAPLDQEERIRVT